jgi:hypothetical protein
MIKNNFFAKIYGIAVIAALAMSALNRTRVSVKMKMQQFTSEGALDLLP